MDKQELNRNYGDFKGWGQALHQFNHLRPVSLSKTATALPKVRSTGYSHIDTLRKLRNQKQGVQQTKPNQQVPQKAEEVAQLMESEVVEAPQEAQNTEQVKEATPTEK